MNWLKSHWRWSALNGSAVCVLVYVVTQGTTGWDQMDTFDSGLESGKWAVRFLLFSLSMTPLSTYFGWSSGIKLRKSAGLWSFGFACLHVLFYLRETPFISWLAWPLPDYLVFGMIGFGILSVMAITSNNWSMKRLAKRWKQLHRRVYIAGMAIMAHSMLATMMSKKLFVRDPEAQRELSVYAAVFCVLLIVRIPVVRKLLLQIPILLKKTRRVNKPINVESLPQIHGRESGVSVEPTFIIISNKREEQSEERISHEPFASVNGFGETNLSRSKAEELVQD